MLTELGKFLRVLRMDRGELLKDMAERLNIAPSYLSSIENGKRTPAKDFAEKIGDEYALSEKELAELMTAFEHTVEEVTINLRNLNSEQVDLSVVFARKLSSLSERDLSLIKKILGGK